eukprot:TRINITY_DN2312_c0_g1_i1.p1 TRINITY_DN2312_c0_g1~~TRINITY_DN2312_c0_g1_i1.p1  ORF type:complete len:268 (+),score=4.69 TRINITY_DN2312_c0_g1_i1:421-1224(+)
MCSMLAVARLKQTLIIQYFPQKDMQAFVKTIKALFYYSKDAKVFVLIHKMDLIPKKDQEKIFEERKAQVIEKAEMFSVEVFSTSIWNETLYQVWSKITHCLIPKIELIEDGLKQLCKIVAGHEVVLFEKSTFLEIAHAQMKESKDPHRYEKISNVIKRFKLSFFGTRYTFQEMSVSNSKFKVHLFDFTKSTVLMVVTLNHNVEEAVLKLNVTALIPYYEKIVAASLTQCQFYQRQIRILIYMQQCLIIMFTQYMLHNITPDIANAQK